MFGGMISSALKGISSNIMSIATADRRADLVKQQYETQARLADYNRQVAENQAEGERAAAAAERRNARSARNTMYDSDVALQEKQRALMAKSGVTSEGTPILVQQAQLGEMALKENNVLYEGYLRSRGHLNKALAYDAQAGIAEYQANVARSIGKYRSKMIKFQKNLTIAKMFYDGANVTSFGEVDNPQQFSHFNLGTLSAIGQSGGNQQQSSISSGYSSGSASSQVQQSSMPSRYNASGGIGSSYSSLLINR